MFEFLPAARVQSPHERLHFPDAPMKQAGRDSQTATAVMREKVDLALGWIRDHRAALQMIGFVIGLLILGFGIALSMRAVPDLFQRLHVVPYLFLLFLAVPATVLVNTLEFQLISAMGKRRVGWFKALEVSVITSIANMLPLPGGAVARAAAMKSEGISLGLAAYLILAFLIGWAGAAFLYSGIWVLGFGHQGVGLSFVGVGVALLVASVALLAYWKVGWLLIAASLALRALGLVLEAFRIMLAASSLGLSLHFDQASIFSTGGVVGSAISIFPGGMGVAEAVMAMLSPLAGLPSGVGFVIGVANRLAVLLGLLWLSALIAGIRLAGRRQPGS